MKIKLPSHKIKENKAQTESTKAKKNKKDEKNVLSEKSKFAIVEAYKSARTNIMFSLSASDKKAFCITSYAKGDGKSTVAANLAISFSKMGKKVLLIDCDLRRPNVHNILKLENRDRVRSSRTRTSLSARPRLRALSRESTASTTTLFSTRLL